MNLRAGAERADRRTRGTGRGAGPGGGRARDGFLVGVMVGVCVGKNVGKNGWRLAGGGVRAAIYEQRVGLCAKSARTGVACAPGHARRPVRGPTRKPRTRCDCKKIRVLIVDGFLVGSWMASCARGTFVRRTRLRRGRGARAEVRPASPAAPRERARPGRPPRPRPASRTRRTHASRRAYSIPGRVLVGRLAILPRGSGSQFSDPGDRLLHTVSVSTTRSQTQNAYGGDAISYICRSLTASPPEPALASPHVPVPLLELAFSGW